MIVEIECLANPPGVPDNRYRHIEAAIAVIEGSGLKYEVEALGTTVEDAEASARASANSVRL